MFTRIVVSALFTGAAAGFLTSLLQLAFVQPVLLHAELYESGTLVHFGANSVSAIQDIGGFDLMRDGLSVVFTMAVYTGYSFLLMAAIALAEEQGNEITLKQGILWGLAGFTVVHMAPGFSLPPEVPGVAAADVYARQFWWFATVGAAAFAVWLIAFGKSWMMWGLAAVLLLAPHIIGAPQPANFAGPVPTELGALFAARALGVGLVAWLLTGIFATYFWQSESQLEN